MKDSIQVHCNSATIIIHKSEKSLVSCWITDVRSVLRLDHIRDQGACFWIGCVSLCEYKPNQCQRCKLFPSPPVPLLESFDIFEILTSPKTFISNSSEILSNCYHHSVSFLHKNGTFNRINCVCFITQIIISTFVNLIFKTILVNLLVGALLSTQPHSSLVPEYSTQNVLWKKLNLSNRYKKCVWRAILTPVIGKMSPRSTFLGLSKNSSCISQGQGQGYICCGSILFPLVLRYVNV